jgi:hypothetical protein
MWIAWNNLLYFSEPFAYNLFDLARCIIPFQGTLSLVKSVQGGLYVSDERGIYFLDGKSPKTMEPFRVADFPAIFGTVVPDLLPGVSFGLQDSYQYCCFATKKGICVGGSEGRFFNLTEEKLILPEATKGSAVLKQDDNILFLFNS